MYYMLECFGPIEMERQAIDSVPVGRLWNRGERFIEEHIAAPFEVVLDGDGIMMPMFNRGILIMRNDLIAVLRSTGVDNIDCYDLVLIDPVLNIRHQNYKAVNIVGKIAAAELNKSVYTSPSGLPMIDTDFDSVALDLNMMRGMLLFRLAECLSAIVIHDKVKKQIEQVGIPYLDFVEPAKWFG